MTHVTQIMLLNCENIEKHTKKIFAVNYENLNSLNDTLAIEISETTRNNIWKLVENLPENDEKKLSKIFLKTVQEEYEKTFPLYKNSGVYGFSVMGSHLPTNANRRCAQNSIFTKTMIKGLAFFIDNNNAIAIEEALEWAFVNPWTPCNTGVIMNPF